MFGIGSGTAPQFENGKHGSSGTLLHRNIELVRLVHFEMLLAEPHLYFRPWRTLISTTTSTCFKRLFALDMKSFQPDRKCSYWESKDALKKAVEDELAIRFGFTIAENGNSFLCGQGKNPKHSTPAAYKKLKLANAEEHSIDGKKTRTASIMRCGCTFRIQYTKASVKMALAPPEAVRITNASFLHTTNGCQPSVAHIQVSDEKEEWPLHSSGFQAEDVGRDSTAQRGKSCAFSPSAIHAPTSISQVCGV